MCTLQRRRCLQLGSRQYEQSRKAALIILQGIDQPASSSDRLGSKKASAQVRFVAGKKNHALLLAGSSALLRLQDAPEFSQA